MKYIQKHYSLKLLAYALEKTKHSANTHRMQNVTLLYTFVSHWLFMHVMAGSLQKCAWNPPLM